MIIAQEKKKSNIIEYLIYMFQIEDVIRIYQFDFNAVKDNIINQYSVDENIGEELSVWYNGLIQQMKDEQICEKGHLQFITNQIADLDDLHQYLIEKQNTAYLQFYSWAKSHIVELQKKSKVENISEVQASLNGLYGYLLLKLQKREISKATQESIDTISKLMAKLNQFYFKIERGELEIQK